MAEAYKDISGPDWQWAETYVFAMATYVVACPIDRECHVGSGVFAFGRPLGEKIRFSGETEITVFGAGALHVRVTDGKGPCRIGFALKSNRPLTWTWPLNGP